MYYAIPLSDVNNLTILETRDAYIGNQRTDSKSGARLTLNDKLLSSILKRINDHNTVSINFLGQDPIAFVTEEAYDRLQINKTRRLAREAARDNGAHYPAPALVPEPEIDEVPTLAIPSEITPVEQIPEPEQPKEKNIISIITESRSHWDNTKDHHRGEEIAEAVTLHKGKPVGVLMSAERAEAMGLPAEILSKVEKSWAVTFAKNHAGFNALLPAAGMVDFKGETLYYTSLGSVLENLDKFEGQLSPTLFNELKQEAQRLNDNLILEYFRWFNPVSLTDFSSRTTSFVRAVNGQEASRLNDNDCTLGFPVGIRHTTALKMILVAGEPTENLDGIEVIKALPSGYREVRKSFGTQLGPNQMVILSDGRATATLLPVSLEHPAFLAALKPFIPSLKEMIDVVKTQGDFKPGFVKKPEAPVVDAVVTATVEPLPPVVDPIRAPAPEVSTPKAEPTHASISAVLANLQTITSAISALKAASEKMAEMQFGDNIVVAFDAARFNESPLSNQQSLAEIYNSPFIRGDEPEASIETLDFSGSAADKVRVLKSAFENSSSGKITILNAGDTTLVMTRNQNFMAFVKAL